LDKNKIEKFKKKNLNKVGAFLLWICLIFLVIKGVSSIINPNRFDKEDLKIELANEKTQTQIEKNAISFAENFAKDYMTFNGSKDDYQSRLANYIDDLQIENNNLFNVDYVNSINYKLTTGNTILVDCVIKGDSLTPNTTSTESPDKITISNTSQNFTKVFYIRIPVKIIDSKNFIICDYPTFISGPNKIDLKETEQLKGTELDDDNKKSQIKKILNSFLKAYYEGANTEIGYFVENYNSIERKKPFEFKELQDLKINWDEKNIFYIKAAYVVTNENVAFTQNMEFKVKLNPNNKFIILDYNTKIY